LDFSPLNGRNESDSELELATSMLQTNIEISQDNQKNLDNKKKIIMKRFKRSLLCHNGLASKNLPRGFPNHTIFEDLMQ